MSFEGYYQLICEKGHYYTEGLYGLEEDTPCPFCKSKSVWWNLVDITNGEGNHIIPELKKRKKCTKCNSILEETFKIPKGGHRI